MRQTITAPGLSLTPDYCYDSLNRLSSANENSGANWSQTYGYDRFGNRWVSASTGYTLSSLTPTSGGAFNTGSNRLFASGYDTAGNQTSDAQSRTFEYDGENRQTKFNNTAGQYFYDGDGRRVKKIDSSGITVLVYNAGGQLIAEYHSDPVPPAAGGGGTSYLTSDHLGSTRVVTKSDGTVKARYDYLPFGEELGSGIGGRTVGMGYSAADSTKQKFTQKERDNESGLDYFLARYYSSAQGRFTSPDEFTGGPDELYEFAVAASENPTFYAVLTNPQSLNKYQYAYNNPLRFVDPDGHQGPIQLADRLLNNPQAQQAAQRAGVWAAGAAAAAGAYLSGALGKLGEAAKNFLTQDVSDDPTGLVKLRANEIGAKIDQQSAQQQQGQQEGQSTNYQPNPKHDAPKGDDRRPVSPQPKAGGSLHDSAVQVKPGQRVNVDRSTGGFVVYRTNPNGQTHGYETTWKQLRNDQRAALQRAGLVTQRGKIIPPKEGQQ